MLPGQIESFCYGGFRASMMHKLLMEETIGEIVWLLHTCLLMQYLLFHTLNRKVVNRPTDRVGVYDECKSHL